MNPGFRPNPRGGTRVPCEIPIRLTSVESSSFFSEPCRVILVNRGGCAVSAPRPIRAGSSVRLEGLSERSVTGTIVNCIFLGQHEKFWLVGVALDEPGNVWGIADPPDDWMD